MSFLTKFFKSRKDEDYETILSNLAQKIEKRQIQLSEIRLRERRATLLVTLYTLAAWGAYVSLWYFSALPHVSGRRHNRVERAVMGAPVLIGPIIILFVRRIVQVWYERKGNAEEKTLQQLLKQQRTKVEEIKKKTNYYTTRDLLQRYDDTPGVRQKVPAAPAQLSTPQRLVRAPNGNSIPNLSASTSKPPTPLTPTNPTRKQWYDKLADALLGDDDHTPNVSASKYALICEKCFAHNGLVKESMWADTQYLCPKCNHFNRSQNSKKQDKIIAPLLSPSSSLSSPSVSRKTTSPSPPARNGAAPEKPLPSERRTPPAVDTPDTTMMEVDTDGS